MSYQLSGTPAEDKNHFSHFIVLEQKSRLLSFFMVLRRLCLISGGNSEGFLPFLFLNVFMTAVNKGLYNKSITINPLHFVNRAHLTFKT